MTSNPRSVPQIRTFSAARAMPLMLTILVWIFAATMETGTFAVLDSGIQQTGLSS